MEDVWGSMEGVWGSMNDLCGPMKDARGLMRAFLASMDAGRNSINGVLTTMNLFPSRRTLYSPPEFCPQLDERFAQLENRSAERRTICGTQ